MLPHRSALVVLITIALAACSAGGGTATGADGTGGGSTGTSSTSSGGPGVATKGGLVAVSSSTLDYGGGPKSSYVVSATFYDLGTSDGGSAGQCQTTEQGECTLTLCTGFGSGGSGPPPEAGTIVVSTPTASATLVPAGTTYAPATGQTMFWSPGDQVTAQASGGVVPAFSLAVPAPAEVQVTAPAFSGNGMMVLSASQDLVVSWSGTSAGKVQVALSGGAGAGTLSCKFDPGAGSGVVPASLLSQLPKSSNGGITVSTVSSADTDAGGFAMQLVALTDATVNGKPASAVLTLQ